MLNIVVVEDNDDLRDAIAAELTDLGHTVTALDCAEAVAEQPDVLGMEVLIVDLNLPGEDGISLTRRMRAAQPDLGVIMITAREEAAARRQGYESGADIYLTKPVSSDEIIAAIQALTRRLRPRAQSDQTIRLSVKDLLLWGPAGPIALAGAEAAILHGLIRAPGQRLETWQIGELLHGPDADPTRAAINAAIFRLNDKLTRADAAKRAIRGVRNQGYLLSPPILLI
jgi:DNA-binding response OmpR family regulator